MAGAAPAGRTGKEDHMTAKKTPPGSETRAGDPAGQSAGPLFTAEQSGGAGSDAVQPAPEAAAAADADPEAGQEGAVDRGSGAETAPVHDLPPSGEMADPAAAPPADAGVDAPGDLRRLNENLEQLLEEMGGLGADSAKTRSLLESLNDLGVEKPLAAEAAPAREIVPVPAADMHRWIETDRRRRRRWYAVAVAIAAPAALLLGLLVEQQFQVIPLHDPTGGWRGHIWDNYGRIIVDCAAEAMRTNAGVDCPLVVRRP